MLSKKNLVKKIHAYAPHAELSQFEKAYDYAKKAHEGQKRASGEPYFTHLVDVTDILISMKMEVNTLITALLHDTIEDTDVTYEAIKKEFGKNIANLVDGVTKLSRIELQSAENKQAENFRKLVLAMSEDIRVLLVKLADRLHNMRTLSFLKKEEKRRRIASETLEIYAPLAERIGMQQIKEELQDLSFRELNPDARESIENRLLYLREDGANLIDDIIKTLKKLMKKNSLKPDINGREKTKFSIWQKMQRKNVAFEQLSDIMAFRIIVEKLEDCYSVLGLIHSEYAVVPGRFKDFISTPKQNGYASLHTTVIGPLQQKIEIQIRTQEMHEIAEYGVAAHWSYKQQDEKKAQSEGKQYRWIRELLDILDNAQRPDEFLENTKMELFQDQVFCFTPQGDLIELPRGACPVDFAYAVHSQVGDTCVGAKINGRIAPLTTKLENGDQVDIVTSKNQTPSPAWERFVVTGKARSRIRRFIRIQQREEYASLGRAMLQKVFRTEGYDFTEKACRQVLDKFQMDEVIDLYTAIGSGHRNAREVFNAIFPSHSDKVAHEKRNIKAEDIIQKNTPTDNKNKSKSSDRSIAIEGLIPGMAVHYARCCHPLPGDRIVGIVTTGKGVTIHTIDCETLESFADQPERWLDVSWGSQSNEDTSKMVGRLSLTVSNAPGGLGTISMIIGKSGGNITNLKITNRAVDFYDLFIDVQVSNAKHLNDVMAALRAAPIIITVDRARAS